MVILGSAEDRKGSAGWFVGVYVGALAICLLGNLAVRVAMKEGWLGPVGRSALAILTVLPLAAAALTVWRVLRRDLDEMLQRVVLEGLAYAVIAFIPFAALYVNLRTAEAFPLRLDAPDLLMAPALFMAAGLAIAWRRYR